MHNRAASGSCRFRIGVFHPKTDMEIWKKALTIVCFVVK